MLPFFLKTPDKFFSDMYKSVNPHREHAFFKWFLHNRKNDIRRFKKKRQNGFRELHKKIGEFFLIFRIYQNFCMKHEHFMLPNFSLINISYAISDIILKLIDNLCRNLALTPFKTKKG
jgi:hypothetical protein